MDDSPVDMSQDLYRPLATPPPLPLAVVYEPVIEKPPRVWTGFTAFGVYFLTTLIAGVVVAVGLVISQGAFVLDLGVLLTLLAISVTAAGGVAIAAAALSPEPLLDRLQLRVGRMTAVSTLVGIMTSCAIGQTFIFGILLLSNVDPLRQLLMPPGPLDALPGASVSTILITYLVIAVGAGVGEELLFRGYMQSRFARRFGFHAALFVTAAVFGLAHLSITQTPFAFVLGLFVGHLSYRVGSIVPAILCHIANNAASVSLMVTGQFPSSPAVQVGLMIVAALVAAGGWLLMIRLTPGEAGATPSPAPRAA